METIKIQVIENGVITKEESYEYTNDTPEGSIDAEEENKDGTATRKSTKGKRE